MITPFVKPGVSTAELDERCHAYMTEHQAYPAPLTVGFPKAVCTSVNHVVCHGIPSDKVLKDGDIINIDVSLVKDEYFGDSSKMFCVGKTEVLEERLVRVTKNVCTAASRLFGPARHFGDIGAVIAEHAHKNGFSVVREYCGHGINKIFHDEPQVLHYAKAGTGARFEPGMIFTIEPMINAGKAEVKLLPDRWTVVTRDRKPSAQWEHTVLVTDNGHEVLSRRAEENF